MITMSVKLYIDENSPADIAQAIKSNDQVMFKHRHCAMAFTCDGTYLYAFDADDFNHDDMEDNDLFRHRAVRFTDVVRDYYGNTSCLLGFLKEMKDAGVELELSDIHQVETLSIDGYQHESEKFASFFLKDK